MNQLLLTAIKGMAQGLAYWLAYKNAIGAVKITEAEAVGEAASILKNKLTYHCQIKREVEYKSICPNITDNRRADLGIFSDGNYQCLLEFKLGGDTNGGYKSDSKKLAQIKQAVPNLHCFVIILYRKTCTIEYPRNLISTNGKALRHNINIYDGKNKIIVRVRRVANAIASLMAKKMNKVIVLEVI